MESVSYDDSKWPLFHVTLPLGDMSDESFARLLSRLDGLFLRGERFGILLDVRRSPPLGAKRRQLVAEHAKSSFGRFPGRCAGVAVVLSSSIQRGVFTAIQWILRDTHPARAFATVREAESWLVSELRPASAREWQAPR
jgi:hypothetical protein